MTREELFDLIRRGEDSGLEFKRDDITNVEMAKELVSLLNFDGGTVLLGVEDDGTISGVARPKLDEWVSELCRTKIDPPIIPFLSWARDAQPGKDVLAVRVPIGLYKPYARVHDNHRHYFIRVGRTCREAHQEELERLFQASGRLRYGLKPVPGATLDDLDQRRLRHYLVRVLGEQTASTEDDETAWADILEHLEKLLGNLDLMAESAGLLVPAVDAVLLFGKNPKRHLPQSGIRALCYPGTEADYATRADEDLTGALLPLRARDGALVESGLVELALDFVRRNTEPSARLQGGERIDRPMYPEAVVREAVVNALVHRDYSIVGADIMLAIFADRLEIASPGRLPNTVTVEGMKAGLRYSRNQTLVNVMRDYRYVESRGMGVRAKLIPGMREHNGTEPEFTAEESRFTVRLWKDPRPG